MLLDKDYHIVIHGKLNKVVAYTITSTGFNNLLSVRTDTKLVKHIYIDTFEEIHKYIKIKKEWCKEYPELFV